MIRRIMLMLAVAALMVATMAFSAVPAFAQECEFKDDKFECGPEEEKFNKEGDLEKLEFLGVECKDLDTEEPKAEGRDALFCDAF